MGSMHPRQVGVLGFGFVEETLKSTQSRGFLGDFSAWDVQRNAMTHWSVNSLHFSHRHLVKIFSFFLRGDKEVLSFEFGWWRWIQEKKEERRKEEEAWKGKPKKEEGKEKSLGLCFYPVTHPRNFASSRFLAVPVEGESES
jgi:hypothetical protein